MYAMTFHTLWDNYFWTFQSWDHIVPEVGTWPACKKCHSLTNYKSSFILEYLSTIMFISAMSDNTSVDVNNCHDNVSHQQNVSMFTLIDGKDYKSRKGCQAGYLIDFTWDIYILKWKISPPAHQLAFFPYEEFLIGNMAMLAYFMATPCMWMSPFMPWTLVNLMISKHLQGSRMTSGPTLESELTPGTLLRDYS